MGSMSTPPALMRVWSLSACEITKVSGVLLSGRFATVALSGLLVR